MRTLLPWIAVCLLVLAVPAWSEEGDARDAEIADLKEQGRALLEQGALDYERLQQALQALEDEKAALGANASLGEMDRLAKRAQLLRTDITELRKARTSLEQAKNYLDRGRFEASKEAFQGAVQRWHAVHQRIVSHIGEAQAPRRVQPSPAGATPPRSEIEGLRQEVRALRTEIKALRTEVAELKRLVQQLAR